LGLEVHADVAYSDTARWLTVVAPEQREGTQLLLAVADDAARARQLARSETGAPALSFATADCVRTYRELTEKGALFRSEPEQKPYGGIGAVLEDTCGNLLNLHQD
jgi:uncharacterized glyoxalase superfamily protein PhnB